eukprot:m.6279 g.6279  ORF g.6279 m.6279 type:complete len:2271 (+) comp3509_c0_seq1:242-7054(+)
MGAGLVETQISYIVSGLSKKNYKTSLNDLHQLLTHYGPSAGAHLIKCLLKSINIGDGKGGKDGLFQTMLLREELPALLSKDEYLATILVALESPDNLQKGKFPPSFLPQLARLAKLNVFQEVQIGLELIKSTNADIQSQARVYLKPKLHDVFAAAVTARVPKEVCHKLLVAIRSGVAASLGATSEECDGFIAAQQQVTPIGSGGMLDPLLYDHAGDDNVSNLLQTATAQSTRGYIEQLTHATSLHQLMNDCGYGCTASVEAVSDILAQFTNETITTTAVARVLGMMANTRSGLGESMRLQSSFGEGAAWEKKSEGNTMKDVVAWNFINFVDAVSKRVPDLNWHDVMIKLDHPAFRLTDMTSFTMLLKAYRHVLKTPCPGEVFLRKWTNVQGQLSVLSLFVPSNGSGAGAVPQEVQNLLTGRRIPRDGLKLAHTNHDNFIAAWSFPDYVAALLHVGNSTQYSDAVYDMFVNHSKNSAVVEVMVMALSSINTDDNSHASTPLQEALLRHLLPIFIGPHPNTGVVLQHVWNSKPGIMLDVMTAYFTEDPNIDRLSRILDVAQDIKAFTDLLQSNNSQFVVELGVLASHREFLNLDKWVQSQLKNAKRGFPEACIEFISKNIGSRARTNVVFLRDAAANILRLLAANPDTLSPAIIAAVKGLTDTHLGGGAAGGDVAAPTTPVQNRTVTVGNTSARTPQDLAKLLTPEALNNPDRAAHGGDEWKSPAPDLNQRATVPPQPFHKLLSTQSSGTQNVGVNRGLFNRDTSNQQPKPLDANSSGSQSGDTSHPQTNNPGDLTDRKYSKIVDDEANSYFQRIYTGQMTIDEVVRLLHSFRESKDQREQDIFGCMIRNLFDEYRFFPQYPDKELHITGILFGSLVQHDLVTGRSSGKALKFVLDALKKDPSSKMHRFGLCGLERFKDKLHKWPQYCEMVCAIPHFRTLPSELQRACRLGAAATNRAAEGGGGQPGEDGKARTPMLPGGVPSGPSLSLNSNSGNALLVTPESEQFAKPSTVEQDVINRIFNNISESNLAEKAAELRKVIQQAHLRWLAYYLVVKRCSIEPNYHQLYLQFMDFIGIAEYKAYVLQQTYSSVRLSLKSKHIAESGSTSERTLLKNLGSFLGLQTLACNKPVLQRDLALKHLLLYAYEMGTLNLMYVIPFVARVVESVKHSRIFRPPNPWTMAIMSLLKELHGLPKLKLNLKFEIELLCKNISLAIEDITPSDLLRNIQPSLRSPMQQPTQPAAPGSTTPESGGTAPARVGPSFPNLTSNISSIQPYISVGTDNQPLLQQSGTRPMVQAALERAIEEIISPVVDRSIKIARIAGHKLVTKDFALEPSDAKMRVAAHNMVRHLAGSLAMVTAKDPARLSIGNHMRTIIMSSLSQDQKPSSQQLTAVDLAVTTVVNENLELACAFIEQTAMERAIIEIDEALAEAYSDRARYLASNSSQPFLDAANYRQVASQLPPQLRVRPGGLDTVQFGLYENFKGTGGSEQHLQAAASEELSGKSPSLSGGGQTPYESGSAPEQPTLESIVAELDAAVKRNASRELASLPASHEVQSLMRDLQSFVSQSVNAEALAIRLAGKLAKTLFLVELGQFPLLREVYLTLLLHLNEAYRGIAVKEVTKVFVFNEGDRKYNVPLVSRLLSCRLIIPSEFDTFIVKAAEGGQNGRVLQFAEDICRQCFISDNARHVSVNELHQTVDMILHVSRTKQIAPNLLEVLMQLRKASINTPAGAKNLPRQDGSDDPPGLREQVGLHFEEWMRLVRQPVQQKGEKADVFFITRLMQQGLLRTDDISTRFFRLCTDLSVHMCLTMPTDSSSTDTPLVLTSYHGVDAFTKLIVVLLKHFGESTKVALLNKVLTNIITVLTRDHKRLGKQFNQKPYFRLLCNLLFEVHATDETINFQVLNAFSHAFHLLRPSLVPGFAFAWLELVSHRQFMPKLLLMKDAKGWQMLQRLLVDLFSFMAPFLRTGTEMPHAIRTLYKGTLRTLLVLLHDFPEFLADHHFSLCEHIPTTCVQMRNLVLSAFPRSMRLPDPFTPNLKIDVLPEVQQSPRILSNFAAPLSAPFRLEIDSFLRSGQPSSFISGLCARLLATDPSASNEDNNNETRSGPRIVSSILNSLVMYVGVQAVEDSKQQQEGGVVSLHAMEVYRHLANELDAYGRYLLFNGLANQLRYPNSHTRYFSNVVLTLFQGASHEFVKEQITRVMLERLIVSRPHPWGLLITFIELMQNQQRYNFWSHEFVRCAPDIQRLFESVSRSCMNSSRVAGENAVTSGSS